jgi:hypothetical protein
MLEILIDGMPIEAGQLELHQQSQPHPGGRRYRIRSTDKEITQLIYRRYPTPVAMPLEPSSTSSLFNLLRYYISRNYGRSKPLFWANTIDQLEVSPDVLELAGVCSPHVEEKANETSRSRPARATVVSQG